MLNTESFFLLTQEAPLEVLVRDRSWDWQSELRRLLKANFVPVDSRPVVVLPTRVTEPGRCPACRNSGKRRWRR
jgi:hypothetical protein